MKYEKDPFGMRIKGYESEAETYLDKTKYTIVRIDGHGFSKWTKGFTKPFDDFIVRTMSETSRLLMDEFKAVVAYSQSDEITLILLPDDNLIYSGRIQKITSLMASFASMKFNDLVREELNKFYAEKESLMFVMSASVELAEEYETINKQAQFLESKIGQAFFDARVFQVETGIEAFNSLLWRTFDCKRNSKNVFAQSLLSHKQCQNKTSDELVQLCAELGEYWHDLPEKYRYGIMWKKESYEKEIDGVELVREGKGYQVTEQATCTRTRFKEITTELTFSEENLEMVLCKKLS